MIIFLLLWIRHGWGAEMMTSIAESSVTFTDPSLFNELTRISSLEMDEGWNLYRQCLLQPLHDEEMRYLPVLSGGCRPRDFDMIKRIGSGAYSTVFHVRHRESGRNWALKRFDRQEVMDKAILRLVRREECILATIQHPLVVSFHCSMVDEGGIPMLVLELIDGEEMYETIFNPRISRIRVTNSELPHIAAQLVSVIHSLHTQYGLIYHDLKLENILINNHKQIKLVDFGLAIRVPNWQTDKIESMAGTADYMAPEVILDLPHGVECDWYSLALVIHELESRQGYFSRHETEDEILAQKMKGLRCNLVNKRVACDLINQMLRFEPELRWGDHQIERIKHHLYFAGVNWNYL